MVVDDEADVEHLFRQRFRKELRSGDLEFVFAGSGERALDLLRDQTQAQAVLILSDINMSGMNGLELLQRIKEDQPLLPVMMITAYGDAQSRQRAQAFGADDYLSKPIDFAELRRKIL